MLGVCGPTVFVTGGLVTPQNLSLWEDIGAVMGPIMSVDMSDLQSIVSCML